MSAITTEPDKYSADLGDWRCATTGWVTAIGGKAIEPTAFHQMTTTEADRQDYAFVTPSAVALHLNSAWRFARDAQALRASFEWKIAAVIPGRSSYSIEHASNSMLFDYFEPTICAAMSSFAAIEAFCNSAIVEKAKDLTTLKRAGRKGTEEVRLSPEEIERKITTDEKFKSIVPGLFGRPTPSGKSVWEKYKRLKALRDAVTHFKRADQARHASRAQETTALQQMIQLDPFSLPETAMEAIRYFYKTEPIPRWMVNPKWAREVTPP